MTIEWQSGHLICPLTFLLGIGGTRGWSELCSDASYEVTES